MTRTLRLDARDAPRDLDVASEPHIAARLLDLGYRNLPYGIVSDAIAALVAIAIVADVVAPVFPLAWGIAAALVTLVRTGGWLGYRRLAPAQRSLRFWTGAFFADTMIMGVLWACCALLFMMRAPPDHQVFLIALLLGVASASMIALSPQLNAAIGFFAIFGLPTALIFLVEPGFVFKALGVLVILYVVFMWSVAREHNRTLLQSIRTGYENETLVESLRAARDQAQSASNAKSQFLANMSHELRTPLNAILGFSELMRDGKARTAGLERYEQYAGLIHDSGQHLLDLINDILDISKAEAGKLEIDWAEVDIVRLTRDSVAILTPTADNANVALRFEPNGALGESEPLIADRRRIRQIILNLVSNAIKFTREGGRVTIRLAPRAGGGIVLAVADTGIGMTEVQSEQAMLPFTQVDQGYEKRYPGTGLGLPLTKTLAELHGGTLTIDSAPGRGTTVTVDLPYAGAPADEDSESDGAAV